MMVFMGLVTIVVLEAKLFRRSKKLFGSNEQRWIETWKTLLCRGDCSNEVESEAEATLDGSSRFQSQLCRKFNKCLKWNWKLEILYTHNTSERDSFVNSFGPLIYPYVNYSSNPIRYTNNNNNDNNDRDELI
jgi:hypothetical protein